MNHGRQKNTPRSSYNSDDRYCTGGFQYMAFACRGVCQVAKECSIIFINYCLSHYLITACPKTHE